MERIRLLKLQITQNSEILISIINFIRDYSILISKIEEMLQTVSLTTFFNYIKTILLKVDYTKMKKIKAKVLIINDSKSLKFFISNEQQNLEDKSKNLDKINTTSKASKGNLSFIDSI